MRLKLVWRVVKDFNQEIRPLFRDFICQDDTTDCMYLIKSAQSATPNYVYFNQLEENNQNSL